LDWPNSWHFGVRSCIFCLPRNSCKAAAAGVEAPNDGLTTTDYLESVMAKHHYNHDSWFHPHPLLLTAIGRFPLPEGIAARRASARPPHVSVTFNSIICS
jgi:hypothetical protein